MNEKEGKAQLYQIKTMGKLDERWAEWFDGMSITPTALKMTAPL